MILFNATDLETMQARQAEQKKLLEQQRKQREATINHGKQGKR